MHKKEKNFDARPFGLAVKQARLAKGWTQEYLATLVNCSSRNIMHIENNGQHPSLDTLYLLVKHLDISADKYLLGDKSVSEMRNHVDIILNTLNDNELVVIQSTANGLKKARGRED